MVDINAPTMFRLVCVLLVWMRICLGEEYTPGTQVFKVSESEFNKVASSLVQPPDGYIVYNDQVRVEGANGLAHYSIHDLRTVKAVPDSVRATIPRDDHIQVQVEFSTFQIAGTMSISSTDLDNLFTTPVIVTMYNVSVAAEGATETFETIQAFDGKSKVILSMSGCHAQFDRLQIDDDNASRFINLRLSAGDQKALFNQTICQMYGLKVDLGFTMPGINVKLFNLSGVFMYSHPVQVHVKNGDIIITNIVLNDIYHSPYPVHDTPAGPSLHPIGVSTTPRPFETWLSADIINSLFKEMARDYGLGVQPLQFHDILSSMGIAQLRQKDLDKLLYYIPAMGDTFPNSSVSLVITGVYGFVNVTNTSLSLDVSVTIDVTATLHCDRSKTFTGFSTLVALHVPLQIGYNNRMVMLKLLGWGGNVTITSSKIGRISDRFLVSLFYMLPHIIGFDALHEFSNKHMRVAFDKLMPAGLHIQQPTVSLAQNYVVIGGELSTTVQAAADGPITWIGEQEDPVLLRFPLYDFTPENATRLSEQNCTVPHVSAGHQHKADCNHAFLVLILCALAASCRNA